MVVQVQEAFWDMVSSCFEHTAVSNLLFELLDHL